MKEQYVKPLIVFEDFSLTQTIARNCGDTHTGTLGQSTHADEFTCTWDLGGVTLFFTEPKEEGDPYPYGTCDDGPDGPDDDYEVDALCYNNPDGGKEIFSSF